MKSKLWMALGAAVAVLGLGSQVQASGIGGPFFDPGDFYVIENAGEYTLVNNSDSWYIWGFEVTNPAAGHGGVPSTTQTNWTADTTCLGECDGTNGAFGYSNINGAFSDFADDVGPNSSSSNFAFHFAAEASDYVIDVSDQNGDLRTAQGPAQSGAPEPASWALMIAGFGAIGAMLRRRRAGALA